jgi:anti-sigma regulatory factor (Ser/Thr protein kinase)
MSPSGKTCTSAQFARMDAVADPQSAAQIRREFSDWLGRHFMLDATKACDMVLAVNEAMANVAEFAYVTVGQPGAMHVIARYDGTAATLTVTVTDDGAWRHVDPATTDLRRGRGIPLMQALADHAAVDSSAAGTRVCLEWNRVATAEARARPAAECPPWTS